MIPEVLAHARKWSEPVTAFADRFKCEDCGTKMPVPLLPCPTCTSRRFVNPEGQRIEQFETAAERRERRTKNA
jgi:DNA-directed RNA polymerase subunit RPC12/RpoP